MSTALWLLLAVSAAAVVGTFVPQETSGGPTVAAWREGSEGPGVGAATVLDALGLFDLFASAWFLALIALLFTSLTGCLVLRWRVFTLNLRQPPPAGRNLDRLRNSIALRTAAPPDVALASACEVLRRHHYRVRTVQLAGRLPQVAAERGRWREGGSLVFHSSFYVLLIAVGLAQGLGFTGQVDLVEGEAFAETHLAYQQAEPGRAWGLDDHRGFVVGLDGFAVRYHPDGTPDDFAATLTVGGEDGTTRTETVRINHPLRFEGMAVYLARFGMAPHVEVRDPEGTVAFSGPVRLAEAGEFAWSGAARVPVDGGRAVVLDLVLLPDARRGPDARAVVGGSPELRAPLLLADLYEGGPSTDAETGAAGQPTPVVNRSAGAMGPTAIVAPGESAPLGDGSWTVTLDRVDEWAGLQVSHQPARGLLLSGALLALAGLVTSLHARHRRVWVDAAPLPGGGTQVRIAGVARQSPERFPAELARLAAEVDVALSWRQTD